MSSELFQTLEQKISKAIEVIELLHLQIEEYEEKIKGLLVENSVLKNRQLQWEQGLSALLRKLADANLTIDVLETAPIEQYALEEMAL